MRALLRKFQLNLGLKRVSRASLPESMFALLKPGRLRLPILTLTTFSARLRPRSTYRYLAPPPMNTGR